MRKVLLATALIGLSFPAMAEGPLGKFQTITVTVTCQQNREDGRILIDGQFLPNTGHKFADGTEYRVTHYTPTDSDETWSHGSCELLTFMR